MGKELTAMHVLIVSLVVVVLATGGLIYYYNQQIDLLEENLAQFESKTLASFNRMENDLENKIVAVQSNLTDELSILAFNVGSFETKTQQDFASVNSLIEQIEQQSNLQLSALQDQVDSIQVQSADFSSIIDDVIESVVSVGTNVGQGSGVVVDRDGFIVTNLHVIEGASIIQVRTYDGDVYNAQVAGFNDQVDIAVLKVDERLEPLRYADSDDVNVGERIIALGNPAGLAFSVSEGIVSAVHRLGPNNLPVYTQTDVTINPGNSGGPLVNADKEIIGINNFKIKGFESLAFAIESNTVEEVSDAIIEGYLNQTQS